MDLQVLQNYLVIQLPLPLHILNGAPHIAPQAPEILQVKVLFRCFRWCR